MIDYSKILSSKVSEIKPSGIRKFFDIAEQMKDVVSLGVGEPDFQTPWHIRSEAITSLEKGKTRYTSNSGLIKMREEIAALNERKYNIKYDIVNNRIIIPHFDIDNNLIGIRCRNLSPQAEAKYCPIYLENKWYPFIVNLTTRKEHPHVRKQDPQKET